MASAKWSSPTVCWAPTNSQRGFAGSSAVRITSTYPFPGRSPDRALELLKISRASDFALTPIDPNPHAMLCNREQYKEQ